MAVKHIHIVASDVGQTVTEYTVKTKEVHENCLSGLIHQQCVYFSTFLMSAKMDQEHLQFKYLKQDSNLFFAQVCLA